MLGVATRTYLATGKRDDASIAVRGEAFARLPLGPRWSGYAAAGLGRTLDKSDWFGTLTLGATAGL